MPNIDKGEKKLLDRWRCVHQSNNKQQMKRRNGKIKRAVFAYFAENPDAKSSILEIACVSLRKDSITASEYESFRRAINSLLDEGLMRKWPYRLHGGYYWYMTPEKYDAYVESTKHLIDLMGDKRSEVW